MSSRPRVVPKPNDPVTQRAIEVLHERITKLENQTLDKHGMWELVARKELKEADDTIEFGGLDGDADGEYFLRGYLDDVTTTAGVYELLINNTAGTHLQWLCGSGAVASAGVNASTVRVAYGSTTTPLYSIFEGKLLTRRGTPKLYNGTTHVYHAGGVETYQHAGWLNNTTTKVTSLSIQRSAGTMARGSWVELYRKRKS